MQKQEISKTGIINLYSEMNAYVALVGKKGDKLSALCDRIICHEANEEIIEVQNKDFSKAQKAFERSGKKLATNYASVYESGDKKGTFVLDENKDFVFTKEAQTELDEQIAIIEDLYEEQVQAMQKEKSFLYIEKVSIIPEALDIRFKNSLAILIEAE